MEPRELMSTADISMSKDRVEPLNAETLLFHYAWAVLLLNARRVEHLSATGRHCDQPQPSTQKGCMLEVCIYAKWSQPLKAHVQQNVRQSAGNSPSLVVVNYHCTTLADLQVDLGIEKCSIAAQYPGNTLILGILRTQKFCLDSTSSLCKSWTVH